MKLAALIAVAALAGSTSHTAAPRRDAFVLLGDGRIVKLAVGSRLYAVVPTRPQTLVVTDRALRVKADSRCRRTCTIEGSFARAAAPMRWAIAKDGSSIPT
jgi:hypothetical protein